MAFTPLALYWAQKRVPTWPLMLAANQWWSRASDPLSPDFEDGMEGHAACGAATEKAQAVFAPSSSLQDDNGISTITSEHMADLRHKQVKRARELRASRRAAKAAREAAKD